MGQCSIKKMIGTKQCHEKTVYFDLHRYMMQVYWQKNNLNSLLLMSVNVRVSSSRCLKCKSFKINESNLCKLYIQLITFELIPENAVNIHQPHCKIVIVTDLVLQARLFAYIVRNSLLRICLNCAIGKFFSNGYIIMCHHFNAWLPGGDSQIWQLCNTCQIESRSFETNPQRNWTLIYMLKTD